MIAAGSLGYAIAAKKNSRKVAKTGRQVTDKPTPISHLSANQEATHTFDPDGENQPLPAIEVTMDKDRNINNAKTGERIGQLGEDAFEKEYSDYWLKELPNSRTAEDFQEVELVDVHPTKAMEFFYKDSKGVISRDSKGKYVNKGSLPPLMIRVQIGESGDLHYYDGNGVDMGNQGINMKLRKKFPTGYTTSLIHYIDADPSVATHNFVRTYRTGKQSKPLRVIVKERKGEVFLYDGNGRLIEEGAMSSKSFRWGYNTHAVIFTLTPINKNGKFYRTTRY